MNKAISPNVELGKDTLLPQNSDILKDFANVKSFFLEIKITTCYDYNTNHISKNLCQFGK